MHVRSFASFGRLRWRQDLRLFHRFPHMLSKMRILFAHIRKSKSRSYSEVRSHTCYCNASKEREREREREHERTERESKQRAKSESLATDAYTTFV